jgi:O-antigen/teichoic acid export membrane protein
MNILQHNYLYIRDKIQQHLSSPFFKNSYYLMASSLISGGANFIAIILATRLFSENDIGLGSATISAIGIISIFAELGLGITIIRFLPNSEKSGNKLINSSLTINIAASLIITLIFISGITLWSPALTIIQHNYVFFFAFIFVSMGFSIQPLVLNIFLAKRESKFIALTNILIGGLRLVFILIFAYFVNSALGFFMGMGLATIISILFALNYYTPKIQNNYHFIPSFNKYLFRKYFTYSLWNYFSRLLIQIVPYILPLLVINILGAEKNAYLYVAWYLASIIQIIPTSICNSLFAEASNKQINPRENIIKAVKQMLLLMLPVVILTMIIANFLLNIFGQSYSDSGVTLLRLFALATIPWGISYLYVSIARVADNLNSAILITVLSTSFSLIFAYALMFNYDLVGMGIGYLIGQAIGAIVAAILMFRNIVKPRTKYSIF